DGEGQPGIEDRHARHGYREADDHALVTGQDATVDDVAQQQWVDDGDHRVDRGRQQEDRQVHPVGPGIPGDTPDRPGLELLLGDGRVHMEPADHHRWWYRPPEHAEGNLPRAANRSRSRPECYQLAANRQELSGPGGGDAGPAWIARWLVLHFLLAIAGSATAPTQGHTGFGQDAMDEAIGPSRRGREGTNALS